MSYVMNDDLIPRNLVDDPVISTPEPSVTFPRSFEADPLMGIINQYPQIASDLFFGSGRQGLDVSPRPRRKSQFAH